MLPNSNISAKQCVCAVRYCGSFNSVRWTELPGFYEPTIIWVLVVVARYHFSLLFVLSRSLPFSISTLTPRSSLAPLSLLFMYVHSSIFALFSLLARTHFLLSLATTPLCRYSHCNPSFVSLFSVCTLSHKSLSIYISAYKLLIYIEDLYTNMLFFINPCFK